MAKLIKSTKEKIERITGAIKAGKEYSKILKAEWQGNYKAKDEWISKFKEYLTDDVIDFLQGEKEIEIITVVEPAKAEKEVNIVDYLEEQDNFRILQEIIEKYKNQEKIEKLIIPSEFLVAQTSIKSIRMSEAIYDSFVKLCKSYNLTIGSCVNYALAQFIEKYKQEYKNHKKAGTPARVSPHKI